MCKDYLTIKVDMNLELYDLIGVRLNRLGHKSETEGLSPHELREFLYLAELNGNYEEYLRQVADKLNGVG
jgi:hypothetical protein